MGSGMLLYKISLWNIFERWRYKQRNKEVYTADLHNWVGEDTSLTKVVVWGVFEEISDIVFVDLGTEVVVAVEKEEGWFENVGRGPSLQAPQDSWQYINIHSGFCSHSPSNVKISHSVSLVWLFRHRAAKQCRWKWVYLLCRSQSNNDGTTVLYYWQQLSNYSQKLSKSVNGNILG